MNAEILCIGTELVLGDIVNTNAQYLSKQLALKGINVFYQSSVGDNPERIIKALSIAVSRSNLIIFTGGLGPTADDITIGTVAKALGIELVKNEEAYERILAYFKRIGRTPGKNNEKQAFLPKDSVVFYNEKGTAPGCAIESGNQCIIFLPGPPSELQAMYENSVSAYLDKYSSGVIKSKFVHIYGVGEAKIDEKAAELIKGQNPTVAPYAKDGEAELRVTAKSDSEEVSEKMIEDTVGKIKSIFGDNVYGYDDDNLQSVVVELLKSKSLTVATAESCTAGYISKRITDISGSSKVFNMGVSTYSNESKTNELSVPPELIKEHGAVSAPVAACMAKGVRIKSGSDIGLSITGIAGPKSDESNKPVGLSFIGISDKNGEYVIKSQKGGKDDREYIRYTSASEALNFLRLYLIKGSDSIKNVQKFSAVLVDNKSEVLHKTSLDSANSENQQDEQKNSSKENNILSKDADNEKNQLSEELSKKKAPRTLNISNLAVIESGQFINEIDNEFENSDIVSEAVSLEQIKAEKNKAKENGSGNIKIVIDDSEYKPVESDDFEDINKQLDKFKNEIQEKKKKPFFKRFFICKGDSKKEKLRKITFLVALIVFIAMIANIAFYYLNPIFQQNKLNSLAKEFHMADNNSDYYSSEINPKFKSFYNENKDIIGWLTIDGTNIDYPVMQSTEDEYYLRRGFNKSYSREGSIFANKASSVEYKKESKNIMLYGHHMVSTGTMFKELDKFLSVDFYKKHPNITFDSLYRDSSYKIFAVFITNSLPEQDNGNFYDYQKTDFSSDKEFESWINEARIRSLFITDINISYDDEILTLQTCNDSFETDDKARLIVMARRTREGEDKDTDTSNAKKNENPKYPQIWYDNNQMVNPFNTTAAASSLKADKDIKSTEKETVTSISTTAALTEPVRQVVNTSRNRTVAVKKTTTSTKRKTTKTTKNKKTTTTKKTTVKVTETLKNTEPQSETATNGQE